ncbi:MAG: hypothetical protein H6Q54_1569 [Deltaproteobacteria bacterium]|jgi:hypothetical protein|nr:hypothetical protein [Deltaproteobacteria bacterium]
MISVVVLMVISSLYVNFITSIFTIQQTLTYVCRRTNNYFVVLLSTSVSSSLLQELDRSPFF